MLSYIWTGFLILSILFACRTGQTAALAGAALNGARAGVELSVSLAGILCLWSGFAQVMERARLTDALARVLRPLLRVLYPHTGPEALAPISANMSANLLGLGNAATPPGIQAIAKMKAAAGHSRATDDMCMLIVVNTASIQLIPATVAALRLSAGAAQPFDILPAVWLTSLCSVCAGIAAARGLALVWRRLGW
mgnify:CR=1 FL=1